MITTDQGRTYIACGENDPRPYEIINTGVGLHVQIVIWARSQLRCNVVTLSLENKKSRRARCRLSPATPGIHHANSQTQRIASPHRLTSYSPKN